MHNDNFCKFEFIMTQCFSDQLKFPFWLHLIRMYRSSETTNQRIYFDIEPRGQHLGSGGQVMFCLAQNYIPCQNEIQDLIFHSCSSLQDGSVHIYNLQTGQWVSSFRAASGISLCSLKNKLGEGPPSFLYFLLSVSCYRHG